MGHFGGSDGRRPPAQGVADGLRGPPHRHAVTLALSPAAPARFQFRRWGAESWRFEIFDMGSDATVLLENQSLRSAGLIGTWSTDVPAGRSILDEGAARLLAGDAGLAGLAVPRKALCAACTPTIAGGCSIAYARYVALGALLRRVSRRDRDGRDRRVLNAATSRRTRTAECRDTAPTST